jgi:hypothetical protein
VPKDDGERVLRFHGVPAALEALVSRTVVVPNEQRVGGVLELKRDYDEPVTHEVLSAPAGGDAVWLHVSLPEGTPPGTYEGTMTVGGTTYPAIADVTPQPDVQMSPGYLVLRAAPGAHVPVTFAVANTGNVDYDIRNAGGFGLFEVEGVEDAIGAALRQERGGEERIQRFADELSDRHGGLTRLAVGRGRGVLKAGEVRDVEVTLRLPPELKPGKTYSGVWGFSNANCKIDIEVEGAAA